MAHVEQPAPHYHDVVVIGASAGGVEALGALLEGLPKELPAALFVVLHISPSFPSRLSDVLQRRARLPVAFALHGEPVQHGRVYVAPPDNQAPTSRATTRGSCTCPARRTPSCRVATARA